MPNFKVLEIEFNGEPSLERFREILEDSSELTNFLVEDVRRHNLRADYCEDSFRILSIEEGLSGGEYCLAYQYEWTAYYGCRDMDAGDTVEESIAFTLNSGALVFKKIEWVDRDTIEEF